MTDSDPDYRMRTGALLLGIALGGIIGYAVGAWGAEYAEGFWGGIVVSSAIAGWWATG